MAMRMRRDRHDLRRSSRSLSNREPDGSYQRERGDTCKLEGEPVENSRTWKRLLTLGCILFPEIILGKSVSRFLNYDTSSPDC
jgi:hypothetical protein